jgi:hypothetical protein
MSWHIQQYERVDCSKEAFDEFLRILNAEPDAAQLEKLRLMLLIQMAPFRQPDTEQTF